MVIESDDWGSIRMPSKEVYKKCIDAGYRVDNNPYERYDSLLSRDDLELLFSLLTGYSDKNGSHPVITANCVVVNPDFEKIKKDNFENYYFELICDTFKRYPRHEDNFRLWKQGMDDKIFYPQFHGREHLNVSLFMDALRKSDPDVRFAFENQMPGSIPLKETGKGNIYVEATLYRSLVDKDEKLKIFLEGLDLFERLFGFRSVSVIPPNYVWSPDYNKPVFEKGVKYFQGIRKICEPMPDGKDRYHTYHLGKKNDIGQMYLVRNTMFEPSLFQFGINDPVGHCLSDMAIAFRMHKPAVITSHRINYVGFIDETNRDRSLKMLDNLISSALKKWPDIEFFTSSELGELIDRELM
jgi:hypothetical protein